MRIDNKGRFMDNFICLPDPQNITEWYYIVSNLPTDEFIGGFYMGVIKNMQEHLTEFNTVDLPVEHIIKFVQRVNPEAWNPAWKQSQVDTDIYQLWLGADFTFEAAYYETYGE